MLHFKARPRKDPTESPYLTPSQQRIMNALRDAMNEVRDAVARNEGKLLDAVMHGPPSNVFALIPNDPWYDAQETIQQELQRELIAAGHRYGKQVPAIQKATVTFQFDESRPEAAQWASKEAGQMITQITEDQRAVVRGLVEQSSMGDMAPRDVARGIRDHIGVTEQQAGWIDNYRARQVRQLQERGLSAAQVAERADRATDRYHARIHRYRSEAIARTEILRASHEGRRQAWGQGLREGYISPNAVQEWSANIDERSCPICETLDMTQVKIGEQFPDGDPPIHPMCRCDILLIDRPVDASDYADMTDAELDAEIESLLAPTQPTTMPTGATVQELRADAQTILADAAARDLPYEDNILYEISRRRGYTDTPEVVSSSEITRRVQSGYTEVFRGIEHPKAQEFVEQFKTGDLFAGEGVFGNGTYTATNREVAFNYAGRIESGVIRMAIPPTAKVIDSEDLFDLWAKDRQRMAVDHDRQVDQLLNANRETVQALSAQQRAEMDLTDDAGRWAAAQGYDAIRAKRGDGHFIVVLNRSILSVEE